MGEKEWEPSDVLDVFGDPHARSILVLASARPLSAEELADQFDVSRPTIYRRVNALIDYDLLKRRQELDPEGNHYQVYETTIRRVSFEINNGGYDINLELRQNISGQFDSFWTELGSVGEGTAEGTNHPDPGPTEG